MDAKALRTLRCRAEIQTAFPLCLRRPDTVAYRLLTYHALLEQGHDEEAQLASSSSHESYPKLTSYVRRDEHDRSTLGLGLYALSSCFLSTALVFAKFLGQLPILWTKARICPEHDLLDCTLYATSCPGLCLGCTPLPLHQGQAN